MEQKQCTVTRLNWQITHVDLDTKIINALYDNDSLLKYVTNVPVELMPEVLAFPLQQVYVKTNF